MVKDTGKYVEQPDGTYVCAGCGARIITATVAHPIWLEEFDSVGAGECEYENVPYCPSCEDEPDFHGEPFYVSLEDLGWA